MKLYIVTTPIGAFFTMASDASMAEDNIKQDLDLPRLPVLTATEFTNRYLFVPGYAIDHIQVGQCTDPQCVACNPKDGYTSQEMSFFARPLSQEAN